MNILSYPLRYLMLRDEEGKSLYARNLLSLFIITAIICLPFLIADASFFGDKGFLDRMGSFTSVLTGFYIAGLVGIASFSSSVGDLDIVIVHGPITRTAADGGSENLTRREYVSSMFGYLSFVSLTLSIGSILLIVVATAKVQLLGLASEIPKFGPYAPLAFKMVRGFAIICCSLIVAHLFITTCHGLYYMIDRLYHKDARILDKPAENESSKVAPVKL